MADRTGIPDVPHTPIPDVPGLPETPSSVIDPTPPKGSQDGFDGKHRFVPGNTWGKNTGHRNRLGGSFLKAMHLSFMEPDEFGVPKGLNAIREMRDKHPAKYIRGIVELMPKELLASEANAQLAGIVVTFIKPPPEIDAVPVLTNGAAHKMHEVN